MELFEHLHSESSEEAKNSIEIFQIFSVMFATATSLEKKLRQCYRTEMVEKQIKIRFANPVMS